MVIILPRRGSRSPGFSGGRYLEEDYSIRRSYAIVQLDDYILQRHR